MNTLVQDYARDGFVICRDLVDAATVQQLRDETVAIARGLRGSIPGLTLRSAADEGALSEVMTDVTTDAMTDVLKDVMTDVLKDVLAIHFPHKVSPLMRQMITHPAIVDVLTRLIGPDLKCMQSMLFVKNAGKPGQAWHQDETFIPTHDASLTGVWIALDDATTDNGCLWVQPGSHRQRHLWPSRPCNDPRFDGAPESFGWPGPAEGGVAAEVTAGSVVFFNGYTLHRSLDNRRSHGFRRALVNHVMSAHSRLPWHFGKSAHAPDDYRDIVRVAGRDPFEALGLEDIAQPYLRPEHKPEP